MPPLVELLIMMGVVAWSLMVISLGYVMLRYMMADDSSPLLQPIMRIIHRLQSRFVESLAADILAEHRENIERHVKHQNIILSKALEEAELVSTMKSDFLASMSHELRTPLNSIIGMAVLMRESPLTKDQADMMQTLEKASRNLLEIVSDILDLSKIESGTLELSSVPFNIQQATTDTIHMLLPLAKEKGLALHWDAAAQPATYVKGDPLRYGRIITNLIGNAIKYTDHGQIRIYFSSMQYGTSTEIHFIVEDTGIGIPDAMLGKIFDKFTQADSSSTRRYGGSGLGLAITKQLVEKMGGSIHVQSSLGKGSSFEVELPLESAAGLGLSSPGEHIPDQSGTLPIHKAHILVAEDHPLNQMFISKLLESIGARHIHVVEDGQQALDYTQSHTPDIILMDCHMPHMSGQEATQHIRQQRPQCANTPIIAMTADAMPGVRAGCIQAGMDDYISKPIEKPELIYILSRWLQMDGMETLSEQAAHADDSVPVLDLKSIRSFSGENIKLEQEFADIFMAQSLQQLEELHALVSDGDSDQWVEVAHKLKGGAATIGAMQMRALCAIAQDMQSSSKENRLHICQQIKGAYSQAEQQLLRQVGQSHHVLLERRAS